MKSFGKIADKAVFVVSLILLVMLGAFTTLYSDDFVYGTYLLDGPAGFIRKNAEHYQNVNGRAFIHLVLEGILYWKDTLFRFVLPLMILINSNSDQMAETKPSPKKLRINCIKPFLV